jgi:hypothetical protein
METSERVYSKRFKASKFSQAFSVLADNFALNLENYHLWE